MTSKRNPYTGDTRKLLVAIDVGTTFTAASFSILEPGAVPKFNEIQSWPKQAMPDAKVPSVILYDKKGEAKAFGAETEDDETVVTAEEEKWVKAAWWKLHLRPQHLPLIRDLKLPPLPSKNMTVEQVLTDFLRYVKEQIKSYIVSHIGDGDKIWDTLFPSMEIILTAPNGWEGAQQQRMREAAFKADIVDAADTDRVRFVSEAEASILYAIESETIDDWMKIDNDLILCDCGGGTVDIAAYKISGLAPFSLQETTGAECYLAGAIFINEALKAYLEKHLKGSEWGGKDMITDAVAHFETHAKRTFESREAVSYISVGGGSKSSAKLGITRGKLKLTGDVVAGFFGPSIQKIKDGLEHMFRQGDFKVKNVVLVGGLAASPYVYSELRHWGEIQNISISRPDKATSKAVAYGALAWSLDRTVSSRINKYHYGIQCATAFLPWDDIASEIETREVAMGLQGLPIVKGCWGLIAPKGITVADGEEIFHDFSIAMPLRRERDDFIWSTDVYVYRREQCPKFVTLPNGRTAPGFDFACKVEADLRAPFLAAPILTGPIGLPFREVNIQIGLTFGQTELRARMRWQDDEGDWCYGAATVTHSFEK